MSLYEEWFGEVSKSDWGGNMYQGIVLEQDLRKIENIVRIKSEIQ